MRLGAIGLGILMALPRHGHHAFAAEFDSTNRSNCTAKFSRWVNQSSLRGFTLGSRRKTGLSMRGIDRMRTAQRSPGYAADLTHGIATPHVGHCSFRWQAKTTSCRPTAAASHAPRSEANCFLDRPTNPPRASDRQSLIANRRHLS